MLRGVLSRVIERVLTLDRLIFMHEAGIPDSYTEEIFDPIISPRSFAVVAAMPAHLADGDTASATGAAGDELCAMCT